MRLASGHAVSYLTGEELLKQQEVFRGYKDGLVRLTPGRWLLTPAYVKYADELYDTKFRSSDVVVMTYPKCGTTWTQEIVWTMRNNPDLNNPMASLPVNARCPFYEMDILMDQKGSASSLRQILEDYLQKVAPGEKPRDGIALQLASIAPDPRTIKTHLPLSLLTPDLLDTAKVVYVARNPKDLCMSYYHHSRLIQSHGYSGTLDQFTQFLVNDELLFSPYFEHVKEAWLKRDHPNMHFIFYEDLKSDIMAELHKLDTFLGTSLSEKQITQVAKHTSFKGMKEREEKHFSSPDDFNMDVAKKDGGFFRKGEVGSWKNLNSNQEAKIELWAKRNTLNMGLHFKYKI